MEDGQERKNKEAHQPAFGRGTGIQAAGSAIPAGYGKPAPSKYVLHTVGPAVSGKVTEEDIKMLESCYRSCLELAESRQIRSVAFCCISTGVFCFPNELAAGTVVRTVREYLKGSMETKRFLGLGFISCRMRERISRFTVCTRETCVCCLRPACSIP